MRAFPGFALLIAAACTSSSPPAPSLPPGECFGSVPYSTIGWLDALALGLDTPEPRVWGMITEDAVVLTVSPPGSDGRSWRLLGRGVCYLDPTTESIVHSAVGPTRRELEPVPSRPPSP